MKEIIGNKSHQCQSSQFYCRKNREICDKKEIAETFNSWFVNISPTLAAPIPENKTKFQNYIH